jgi:hypothetical protein
MGQFSFLGAGAKPRGDRTTGSIRERFTKVINDIEAGSTQNYTNTGAYSLDWSRHNHHGKFTIIHNLNL